MTAVWFLLIAGLILIVAEVFLPGMIVGSIGAVCLAISVVLAYGEKGPIFGTVYLGIVIVLSLTAIGLGMKYFPRTAFGQRMVLQNQSPNADELDWLKSLQGKSGTAHTQLRPAGTAMIDGKRVDVVTEGGIIPKGSEIKVVAVEGYRVVVRKV